MRRRAGRGGDSPAATVTNVDVLRAQANQLERQLEELKRRIREGETTPE
jgi:hypothetical protein